MQKAAGGNVTALYLYNGESENSAHGVFPTWGSNYILLSTLLHKTKIKPVFFVQIWHEIYPSLSSLLTTPAMSAILLLKGKEIAITPRTTQQELHGKLVAAMGGKLKTTDVAEVEISKVTSRK